MPQPPTLHTVAGVLDRARVIHGDELAEELAQGLADDWRAAADEGSQQALYAAAWQLVRAARWRSVNPVRGEHARPPSRELHYRMAGRADSPDRDSRGLRAVTWSLRRVVDLYCDADDAGREVCRFNTGGGYWALEDGQTLRNFLASRRREGWYINGATGYTTCPDHAPPRRSKPVARDEVGQRGTSAREVPRPRPDVVESR